MATTLIHDRGSATRTTLEAALAPLHHRWNQRVARTLAPALAPEATFWERWGATRFLADQFDSHLALQGRLADGLAPLLEPSARLRLDAGRREIDRIREQLVDAGRRRGTGGTVAGLGRRLIERTRLWCTELEAATRHIPLDGVPEDSRVVLERFRAAVQLEL